MLQLHMNILKVDRVLYMGCAWEAGESASGPRAGEVGRRGPPRGRGWRRCGRVMSRRCRPTRGCAKLREETDCSRWTLPVPKKKTISELSLIRCTFRRGVTAWCIPKALCNLSLGSEAFSSRCVVVVDVSLILANPVFEYGFWWILFAVCNVSAGEMEV
jgi:hypothetical protein